MRTHTIEEALEIIRLTHEVYEKRPIIISLFGSEHYSEKKYFCKHTANILHKQYTHDVAISKKVLDIYVKDHYNELAYLIYDPEINIPSPDNKDIYVWNNNIRPMTGRPSDINIFIYNPKIHTPDLHTISKYFDIIIKNDSTIKNDGAERKKVY